MAGRETPATRVLAEAGVDFELREYEHDPAAGSYALEAADALGLDPDAVFKTLVVDLDGSLAVCLVPAAMQLDTRALGKRVALAPPDRAERVTGYVTGGISPFGQRRPLPTIVDELVEALDVVWVSGGRRGLEIGRGARGSGGRAGRGRARDRPLGRGNCGWVGRWGKPAPTLVPSTSSSSSRTANRERDREQRVCRLHV